MAAVNLTDNFFQLFGLPIGYDVNAAELAERFRTLQHTVHPDKFANASDLERRVSVQHSARINEAYQTLKNPLLRARYLLQLKGVETSDSDNSVMDSGFLMQQMELREQLEQIKSSTNAVDQLHILNNEVDDAISQFIEKISALFTEETDSALQTVSDYVNRLQFMLKLQGEIHALEEELV